MHVDETVGIDTKDAVLDYVRLHEGADYLEVAVACEIDLKEAVRLCRELVAEGRLKAWPAVADGAQ